MENSKRLALLKKEIGERPYDGGALARYILVHASLGHYEKSAELFARVSPFFGDTAIKRLLSDIAGERIKVGEHGGLFVVGELKQSLCELLSNVARYACTQLKVDLPCIVVEVGDAGSSFSLHEIDGVSLVKLLAEPSDIRCAAVHEFSHCLVRSNHRFFDEGLATLMEYRIEAGGEPSADAVLLSRALRILVADRSSNRPCLDQKSDYRAAAQVVEWMLTNCGLEPLKEWFSTVKDLPDDALVSSFETICGKNVEAVEADLFRQTARFVDIDLDHAAIDRAFLLGDVNAISDALPALRAAFSVHQDTRSLESLIKALLLHADAEPPLAIELESLVSTYRERKSDSEIADMFLFILEAQRVRRAPNFLVMHEHLAAALRLQENLLNRHPCSVAALLSAAKFQLAIPIEYGGGMDSARVYLERALALAHEGSLAGVLHQAIKQYEVAV